MRSVLLPIIKLLPQFYLCSNCKLKYENLNNVFKLIHYFKFEQKLFSRRRQGYPHLLSYRSLSITLATLEQEPEIQSAVVSDQFGPYILITVGIVCCQGKGEVSVFPFSLKIPSLILVPQSQYISTVYLMLVFAVICLHSKPINLAKIAKDPKKLIRGVFSSIATELPYCATKQQKEHDCFQEQDLPLSTASHLFSHHEINRRAFPPYEKSLKFSQRKKFWRGEKKN